MDQFHRDHATVELAIRDLKEGAGMELCPSGEFFVNAAILQGVRCRRAGPGRLGLAGGTFGADLG